MEDNKKDFNSIIGLVLIFFIFIWIIYQGQTNPKAPEKEKTQTEAPSNNTSATASNTQKDIAPVVASVAATPENAERLAQLQAVLGSFAYSATLPSAKDTVTVLENDLVKLKIANKGGYVSEVILKKYERFHKNSGKLVELIKDGNSNFNIQLATKDNKVLNSKDLYFEPTLIKEVENQILTMRLKASANEYLEYKYVLKPNDYMLDFDMSSSGLKTILNTSKQSDLQWDLRTNRNEKSISYENRYTEISFGYEEGKHDYVGQGKDKQENPNALAYVAFKQHLFTSILISDKHFKTANLHSADLVDNEEIDTVYTKQFTAKMPLAFDKGEINYKMKWFFGPADYKLLQSYDKDLEKIIPLGWGIFGWINKLIFIPFFGFLSSHLSFGLAIILFTILVKIFMSPVTYKSFLSQAKMKVLRPEINELNEKFKKDPMKKQQEMMKLYSQTGVNPMAGCIPALIQIPVMYASFLFFPSAISLRQQKFLWAEDLSSFDSIYELPFKIPFYGDHISLFPILAAIAIFFYMKMTSGDQQMAAPQQEGMPDMSKMMKIMIYVSPVMMLIFFNNYGSGLSLYNFISNLVTIGIMFVIKNYIVDSDKIHAKIQQNKLKEPKKKSKFQQKLHSMMEQAEEQKAQTQKLKNKKK